MIAPHPRVFAFITASAIFLSIVSFQWGIAHSPNNAAFAIVSETHRAMDINLDSTPNLHEIPSVEAHKHVSTFEPTINESAFDSLWFILNGAKDRFLDGEATRGDLLGFAGACLGLWIVLWILLCTEYPEIHGSSTSMIESLIARCPHLMGVVCYRPPLFLFNAHIQLLYQEYIKQDAYVNYTRETLTTPDKGTISLDWVNEMPDYGTKDERPLLLILHGLTGGSHELYMKTLSLKFAEGMWRVVAFNRRGCGYNKITSPLVYTYTTSADLEIVLQVIQKRLPNAPIYACGLSAGSNALLKYLGQVGANTCIQAAVSVANAYDISLGTKTIQENPLYNLIMAAKLKNLLLKTVDEFRLALPSEIKEISRSVCVRHFDDIFTRKYLGYETLEDYYESQSCIKHLGNISIPVLCLHALDDPIVPPSLFPWEKWQQNPKLAVVTTKRGGHLTWMQGILFAQRYSWMDNAIFEFLNEAHKAGPLTSRRAAVCLNKLVSLQDPHPNLRDLLLSAWTNRFHLQHHLNLDLETDLDPVASHLTHITPYIPPFVSTVGHAKKPKDAVNQSPKQSPRNRPGSQRRHPQSPVTRPKSVSAELPCIHDLYQHYSTTKK